jgi:hypothetical protein
MKPLEYAKALFLSSAGSTRGGMASVHASSFRELEQAIPYGPGDLIENAIPGWDNPWIDLGGEG